MIWVLGEIGQNFFKRLLTDNESALNGLSLILGVALMNFRVFSDHLRWPKINAKVLHRCRKLHKDYDHVVSLDSTR